MIVDYHAIQNNIDHLLYYDDKLNNLVKGIYINRGVPDGASFPYVSKGSGFANPGDTKQTDGANVTYQIDVWGRRDDWEIHEIMMAVQDAMQGFRAETDRTEVFDCRLNYTDVQLDPDGYTRHGILQYRIFQTQKERRF
ncbi:DUF3168 domain-containing protein [Salicibibacter cibarius]|uniref:DUF3168 domain-containing protein n=1 Tax=Salicibibacter cibarius TaxID=2743000 RepID=A0A7T7CAQ2_9BACI|nr:DUF3168 domain-containing protein [Salicibibacter cibarius]QQK75093.1 DUF3168 domain-containing protein [Salicibibacter cibarius]QQK75154.1 DUF3168 domain-containing protein [Salicibibacter cibarius]